MDKDFTASNYQRTQDRKIDEFIGICKGVLADNEFNELERNTLMKWLNENRVNDIQIKKIYESFKNNTPLSDLKKMLEQYIGYNMQSFGIMNASTSLPIENMLLSIKFKNESFCLTAKFASAIGNRKAIEDMIKAKNGIIKSSVVLDLDYLVIGELGNADWIHSNSGRKIEKALRYREENKTGIKIISEQQLLEHL